MDDAAIVSLYWARDPKAVEESAAKYSRYCYTIARRITPDSQDADESVNDTWLHAWQSMPPHRPSVLSLFLGKLTRRISLNRWRDQHREKRGGGEIPLALDELAECLPSPWSVEAEVENRELAHILGSFLNSLPDGERDVFVCRYWFLSSVEEISQKFGYSESKVKSMLFRTRKKLKACLMEVEQ